jgi:hypothetical protein
MLGGYVYMVRVSRRRRDIRSGLLMYVYRDGMQRLPEEEKEDQDTEC